MSGYTKFITLEGKEVEMDRLGNIVPSQPIFDHNTDPLPERNVNCITIRQHFALEIYKSMIAGRDSYIGSDEYVTQDSYSLAIDAADGLLAELEKDEK
jgi:hypothetical protein